MFIERRENFVRVARMRSVVEREDDVFARKLIAENRVLPVGAAHTRWRLQRKLTQDRFHRVLAPKLVDVRAPPRPIVAAASGADRLRVNKRKPTPEELDRAVRCSCRFYNALAACRSLRS